MRRRTTTWPVRLSAILAVVLCASALVSPTARAATEPVLGRTVAVAPVHGTVLVKVPRAHGYVPLTTRRLIPVGSALDTRKGRVAVTAAAAGVRPGAPALRGTLQKGVFDGAAFILTQRATGLTVLSLTADRRTTACGGAAGDHAMQAKANPKVLATLNGRDTSGQWQTRGRNAAGTVRGTVWTTKDTCSGTVIVDHRGDVQTSTLRSRLQMLLAPGESVEYRCVPTGMPPVSSDYCVVLLSVVNTETINGTTFRRASFAAGLSTISPAESLELCVTPPGGTQGCAPFPLSPPDERGFRSATSVCSPNAGPGNYTVSWLLGGAMLGTSLVYHAPHITPLGNSCSGALGQPAIGPETFALDSDVKDVQSYSLPTAAASPWLDAYLGPLGTTGAALVQGVLYADSAGTPGPLVAATNPISITPRSPTGWTELPFPKPLELPAGTYWIGLLAGGISDAAGVSFFPVPGNSVSNGNAFPLGPSNPFGALSGQNTDVQMSLYLFYDIVAGGP